MSDRTIEFLKEVENAGITLKTLCDVKMKEYTTFRIGGVADVAFFPDSRKALMDLVAIASKSGYPFYIVGKGSNLLVDDKGYRGAVIFTGGINTVEYDDTNVYADAGVNLTSLARATAQRGLSGLEFACGIPGTVGGAVYMNAGAYDSEMKNVVTESSYYSLTLGEGSLRGDEQGFGYRTSAYMGSDKIILGCTFSLKKANNEQILESCQNNLDKRRDKQPLEYASAGSTFKRYPGRYTAKLIDEAGLKGFCIGDAQVSEKHAGFVINRGDATSKDTVALIKEIKRRIFEREGIEIECEVRYLTEEGEVRL